MARNSKKWNVNEILSLQREFELLQMSIDDIAKKHKRTPKAIMYKLHHEGFARFDSLFKPSDGLKQGVALPDGSRQGVAASDSQQGVALHCPSLGQKPNVLFESGFPSFGKTIISFLLQKFWIPFVESLQKL
jgi:hypothetical protein